MDDRSNHGGRESGNPGMIEKAAHLAPQEITEAELKAINKYTLEPLTADQVFTFKAVLCDNELDRAHERFNLKALQDLKKLFLGKTIIKDHKHSADNQVARIYATELVESEKAAHGGEKYTQLVARCYMFKTAGNADLIAEIKAGIKKEGSVGCAVNSVICSICGMDNAKTYCAHWPGRSYEKDGHMQMCTFTLAGARDAYEFSLVAVPAQRAAGVSKSYTGETAYEAKGGQETPQPGATPSDPTESEKAAELALQAELAAIRAKNTNYN
ncbi:MAG: hypothetical protein IKY92_03525 [Akkermansia sp.]|nr:hypothetical protein [Akkermansia sp.]